jgi:aldehyde:ferredoxin oxidoreductase
MNALNGFSEEDDDLPARFFHEAGSSGDHIDIAPINRQDFLDARSKYYRIRGLDPAGCPVGKKAGELGLEWND